MPKLHNVKFQDKTISSLSGKNLFSPKIQCSVRSQNVYQALSYNVSVIIFCTASCKVQNVRWLLGRQIITFVCHDLDNFFSSLYVRERLQKTEDTSDKSSFSKAFSSSKKCVGGHSQSNFFSSFDRIVFVMQVKYKWGRKFTNGGKKQNKKIDLLIV